MDTTQGNVLLFRDHENEGWIKGWGVLRQEPWHLAGLFATELEANELHAKLGADYVVAYGAHRRGSEEFIHD